MEVKTKFGFLNLAKKSFAAITASLGVLLNSQSEAITPIYNLDEGKNINQEKFQKRILKSQLVLKLNPKNIEKPILAGHSSHSSHSSHYSGSSGNSGSSSGRDNNTPYWLVGGGLAAYGLYKAGKGSGKKK